MRTLVMLLCVLYVIIAAIIEVRTVKEKQSEINQLRQTNDSLWRDVWNIRTSAINWFKNNLGACILKGKILAIPIIDIT